MTESVRNQIRDIVADLFLVPAEEIGPVSSPDTIERWDSMQHLNLVLALEQAFGIQLSPEDIQEMTTVGRVMELVEEKLLR